MADRARRAKQDKLAKLAELKRAREGGGRNFKVRSALQVNILCYSHILA